MKVGAEPKKVGFLIALGVLAAYLGYTNLLSDDDSGPTAAPPPAVLQTVPRETPQAAPNIARDRRTARGATRAQQEFRPTMKRRPEDAIDPTKVDPTLRKDLLAKLQSVKIEGGERSLFDFAQPPPPPQPKMQPVAKIIPKPLGPEPPSAPQPKVEPVKPPPPPIPLKFYGFINPARTNVRRAFFLDGDDIIVAGEGDTIRQRYRVVRIGISSVVMEDVEHKHQQTLPLVEEPLPG